MATKQSFIDSVLSEIGRADKQTAAEEWFDDIYQTVISYNDWSFITVLATRATVANTYKYALPLDFRKRHALWMDTGNSNSRKLDPLNLLQFVEKYPRLESLAAAEPIHYTTYGNVLIIAPKPSSIWTFQLVYTYNPPNLTVGQTPIIPERWYNCLRLGLRAKAYDSIREFEKGKAHMEKFDGYLKLMQKDDKEEGDDDLRLKKYRGAPSYPSEYWLRPDILSV